MRGDAERLMDILEAIEKIEKYASKGRETYFGDELIQTWTVSHVQIIGEAAANLSWEIREENPSIPWTDIVARRNVLVHQYSALTCRRFGTQ